MAYGQNASSCHPLKHRRMNKLLFVAVVCVKSFQIHIVITQKTNES